MGLGTYDELKAEVAAILARSDVTSSSSVMDVFICQAEADINRRLKTVRNTKKQDITTDGTDITLNADFHRMRSLEFDDEPKDIQYTPDSGFGGLDVAGTSRPKFFSIVYDDQNERYQLRFGPNGSSYDLTLKYYAKIPALTSSNTTNWLLSEHPQTYLDGCLYYAYKRYRNKEEMRDYETTFAGHIEALNRESNDLLFGPAGRRIQGGSTL